MKKRSIFLMVGVASLYFQDVYGQKKETDSLKSTNIEQVVITGNTRQQTKLESATAISTFSAKEIQRQNPISTAALLQRVPGFAVETTGGEVGNNLFSRGMPSAGSYEFVQLQEDGLPVFEDGALQFANADNYVRIDNMIRRIEALRGGTGSIFASNAPGGIINFINKEGSNDFAATTKFETSSYGMFRTDLNLGGALVQDKLFFDIGGFYRTDHGVKSPGFTANKGGEIKMNLKYVFDKGYVKLSYKKLNDRNLFYVSVPVNQVGNKITAFPGFDPHYGTLTNEDFAMLSVPQPDGSVWKRNLENGIHPNVDVITAEFKYDLGAGFKVVNKARVTNINQTYDAIFPSGAPVSPSDFAAGYGLTNYQYSYVNSGAVANPAYVMKLGFWSSDKQMRSFMNDLRFSKKFGNVDLDFGYYKNNWSSHQYWNWSNLLVEVSDKPKLLNLVNTSLTPSSDNYSMTYNGISDMSWLTRESQLQADENALYVNSDIKVTEKLNFNAGLRYQNDLYEGYNATTNWGAANLDNTNLKVDGVNGFNTTKADNWMTTTGGPYYHWKYRISKMAGTFAANYKLHDKMAFYGRYSHGFRAPLEEAFYDNAHDLSKIKPTVTNQYEFGYKWIANSNINLGATAFYSTLDNIAFTDVGLNGQSENKFGNTKNIGIEVEGFFALYNGMFDITFNGTLQNPQFVKYSEGGVDMKGNQVRRIPKYYFIITPAVNITKEWRLYLNYNRFGTKYADNANVHKLPGYGELGAGMSYQFKNIRFAVDGTNLTNTLALTEGDTRFGNQNADGVVMARPLIGTAIRASVIIDLK